MNEGTKAPVPGSASALKQRREAYEIVRSAPEEIGNARARLDLGMAKEALADLNSLAKVIEANPEARRMLAGQQPETLRALNTLRSEAAAEVPNQVRQTGGTDWVTYDGVKETKVYLGESAKGHHYALEVSVRGGDSNASWSKPFPTAEAARSAGLAAESREQDMTPERHPWQATTPQAQHAERLNQAAEQRQFAASANAWQKDPGFAAPNIDGAKERLAEARNIREQATDIWGSRERVGHAARAADAPKPAQRAGQNMSAGG